MTWEISPEPADEQEREALLLVVGRTLQDAAAVPSRWWSSALDELGGGAAAQESWRDAGVVEP